MGANPRRIGDRIICKHHNSSPNRNDWRKAVANISDIGPVVDQLCTDDERWYWELKSGSKLAIVSLLCLTMAFYSYLTLK
jgi:hypothetical protein